MFLSHYALVLLLLLLLLLLLQLAVVAVEHSQTEPVCVY
jgi:hypothetical protein